MSNPIFYYFFAPTWDFPPEGPIKLGNVITSVKKPDQPLYTAPLPTDSELFSSEKSNVEYSMEKSRGGNFSILTKFLSILGVGMDVGANWGKSTDDLFAFDRIDTAQFVAKEEYLQKCVEAAPVRRYLDKSRYRKPVYIITGIKTVTGAKAKSHKSGGVGGNLGIKGDGTVSSGGPMIEGKTENKAGTTWGGSSDFVFAFRVRKVWVKQSGTLKDDYDYTAGALLGNEVEREAVPDLSISADEDPKAEDEGFETAELMEGDTTVFCAVPKAEVQE